MKIGNTELPIIDFITNFDGTRASLNEIISLIESRTPSPDILEYCFDEIKKNHNQKFERVKNWYDLSQVLQSLKIEINGKIDDDRIVKNFAGSLGTFILDKVFEDGQTTDNMQLEVLANKKNRDLNYFKFCVEDEFEKEFVYWRSDTTHPVDIKETPFIGSSIKNIFDAAINELIMKKHLKPEFNEHSISAEDVLISGLLYKYAHPLNKWPTQLVKEKINDGTKLSGMSWKAVDLRKINGQTISQIFKEFDEKNLQLSNKKNLSFIKIGNIYHFIKKENIIRSGLIYRQKSIKNIWPNCKTIEVINDGTILGGMTWHALDQRQVEGMSVSQIFKEYEDKNPYIFKNTKVSTIEIDGVVHAITKQDVITSALIYKSNHPESKWPTQRVKEPINDGTILNGLTWGNIDKKNIEGMSVYQIIKEYEQLQKAKPDVGETVPKAKIPALAM